MTTIQLYPTPRGAVRPHFGALVTDALFDWWRGRARRAPRDALVSRRGAADEFADLRQLDSRLLRDIGAPDHLLARALAHRDSGRAERDALRLGIASAAWQHW
jgi:hypothetical protein